MIDRQTLLAAEKKVLENSFKLFVRDAWEHIDGDEYIHNWHIESICDALQIVSEGGCTRLLINMPPGFAKSLIISVLWPAWTWTWKPQHRFLSTSYSLDLSQRDSRKMRQLVTSDWYQARWPVKLKADQNEKTNFENMLGGKRAIRAFTSLTGDRGDTVIVDDPHSMDAAWSETERKSAVQTFKASVPSRLHNRKTGSIVVVLQRLHDEDVSGFIIDNPDLGYVHLCLPHEYEAGHAKKNALGIADPRTKEGELLFPAFFPADKVKQEKASLGPDWWGQHQQRPTPRTAGAIDVSLFNRYKPYIKDIEGKQVQGWPEGCTYYMTSDHALGTNGGDYNVFRMWAYDSNKNLWLVDSFREVCSMYEALGVVTIEGKAAVAEVGAMAMIRKWKPWAYYPEDDNNWKAVRGYFENNLFDLGLQVNIEAITPHGKNKLAKVQGYISLANQGRINLPEGSIGNVALEEYRAFPHGKKDDQVDADGMIGRVIDRLIPGHGAEPPEVVEQETGYRGGLRRETTADDTFFI